MPAATAVLLASACGVGEPRAVVDQEPVEAGHTVVSDDPVRVIAVGDIACPPDQPPTSTTCRQAETATAARRYGPDLVLTLGDHQYPQGTAADFRASYDSSWGSLLDLTRPAPGNHEYDTAGARGYYEYFADRQPGPPGYYRVAANDWNIYVLNSNCGRIPCATEAAWLDREMAAHPARCSIVTMHHPRYSSGLEHGNNTAVRGLWEVAYKHGVDIALASHDQHYERFRPMDAYGRVDLARGVTSYVSGAGGAGLRPAGKRQRGSVYFQSEAPGVLALLLREDSWSWGFRDVDGRLMDGGNRTCR